MGLFLVVSRIISKDKIVRFFLVISCLLLSSSAVYASVPTLPRLFFSYSWLYDNVACEMTPVDASWAKEIEEKTEHFAMIWSERGPALFQVLFNYTNVGFSRKEMTATFSVCPKKPSLSTPLAFNMTKYLKSYMGETPVKGDDVFVDLIFHELIHNWLVENLKSSEMINKYKNENMVVRNHMHLMAIQKFVYSELNRSDLVLMLDKMYKAIGGDYARSWEIVGTEGEIIFMQELSVQKK